MRLTSLSYLKLTIPLNDESYTQVMHFCKMMCATVPLMEQDEALRNLVHRYVMEVVDNEPEDVM